VEQFEQVAVVVTVPTITAEIRQLGVLENTGNHGGSKTTDVAIAMKRNEH